MKDSTIDLSREAVTSHVLGMLGTLTQETDLDPITLDTPLSETGLDSVCVAYLIGEIQQYYGLGDALFRALVAANLPVLSLRLSQLVDTVCENLAARSATSL